MQLEPGSVNPVSPGGRADRIDYQFNPATTDGARGDSHGAVKIMSLDLGSH
jgi:hypothetical protein